MASTQRGFTIIEVIMFLAISGLLLAIAIASINANINNSRFNDAVRATTSYLQRQYSEVASGQSDRSDTVVCDSTTGQITTGASTSAGMTDCVIMGRFIKLQGSVLTVRYITGHRASLVGISADDTQSIRDMNPIVAPTIAYEGRYDIPWGIGLVNTELPGGVISASTGFAIIRSPASGNVLYYTVRDITVPAPTLDATFIHDNNLSKNAVVCLADDSSSRVGRIKLGNGQGQEIIQTDLATGGNCP